MRNEPLGTDYAEMKKRAETLNGIFDEWDQKRKGQPISSELMPKYGTVHWLFREYKISKAYVEKVADPARTTSGQCGKSATPAPRKGIAWEIAW